MFIRINGEAVDFSLEAEQSLGEVVQGVQSWAAGQGLAVTGLTATGAGGGVLDRPREGWQAIPLAEVDGLEVTVEGGAENAQSAAPGAQSAAPGAQSAAEIMQAAAEAAARLEEVEHRLPEVPLLLQTGKDRQAMEAVILLSDRLQAVFAVLDRLRQAGRLDPAALVGGAGAGGPGPDAAGSAGPEAASGGQTLLDFASGLNGVLRELQGSFENRDSVLIGDLLEYEVVPRLAALRSFAGSLA